MISTHDSRLPGPTLRKNFEEQVRIVSKNIGEVVMWSDDEMDKFLKEFHKIELQFDGHDWWRAPKAKLRYWVAELHNKLQCDHSEDIGPWAKWEPAFGSDKTKNVGKAQTVGKAWDERRPWAAPKRRRRLSKR